MRLPVASEGWPIILSGAAATLISALAARFVPTLWPAAYLAVVAGGFTAFSVYFFRDPDRTIPEGDELVLSPADGTVVDVRELDEPDFHGGPARRVSIFMSPLNVHVNRSPVAGRVTYEKYHPGRFELAWRDKASELNEQNSVGIEADGRKYLVRQIAGWVARRIVCRVKPSQDLAAGERFGMIQFGSRVDLFVPVRGITLKVDVGQKVYGGISVIGVLDA